MFYEVLGIFCDSLFGPLAVSWRHRATLELCRTFMDLSIEEMAAGLKGRWGLWEVRHLVGLLLHWWNRVTVGNCCFGAILEPLDASAVGSRWSKQMYGKDPQKKDSLYAFHGKILNKTNCWYHDRFTQWQALERVRLWTFIQPIGHPKTPSKNRLLDFLIPKTFFFLMNMKTFV